MEYTVGGMQRHRKLPDTMRQAPTPLSGGAPGRKTGVSRQVVIQDITLLRTTGYPILSTAHGYVLNESRHVSRLFKVCHTNEQTEDELVTIMDLGGTVADAMVNRRIYGEVSAPLDIKNHCDAQLLTNNIQTGKSIPLMNVTPGYHFHHICAKQKEILDEMEEALRKKHYLADLLPYEMSDNE